MSLIISVEMCVNILNYRGYEVEDYDETTGIINLISGDWVLARYHPILDFLNMEDLATQGITYIPVQKKQIWNAYNPKPIFVMAGNAGLTYILNCDVVRYESTFYELGPDVVCPIENVQFNLYESYYVP